MAGNIGWRNTNWRDKLPKGVHIVDAPKPEYHMIGTSFNLGKYVNKGKVPESVTQVRQAAIDFINKGSLKSNTGIYRGVSAGNFYNTNPQYVLEQFVGENAIQDGSLVFGFDIEALGGFQKGTTSPFFAPTEIAIQAYNVNLTNPTRVQVGSKKLNRYFNPIDGGNLNIVRKLDNTEKYIDGLTERQYFDKLLDQLKKVNSINSVTGISRDDMRSLRDLMKYAGDAKFANGGVISHNTAILPGEGMLTAKHVKIIQEGLDNMDKYGIETDEWLRRTNNFVNKYIQGRSSFKTMSYNGNYYDMPGLRYRFGDQLTLLNKTAGFTGNIDWYDTTHSLYMNPSKKIFGSGIKADAYNFTQANIASYLFGYNVSGAHAAAFDIKMQEHIANYMMGDVEKTYMNAGWNGQVFKNRLNRSNPTRGAMRMATFNPGEILSGDRLYARRGAGASEDNVFDMVFRLNQKTHQFEHVEYYSNPILSGKTYVTSGSFEFDDPTGKTMYGLFLHNIDDDLYHMYIRPDQRGLQNLIHEKFSFAGRSGNIAFRDEADALRTTYSDAARRKYVSMFTPGMEHKAGYGYRTLTTYLNAHDIIEQKLNDATKQKLKTGEITTRDLTPDATVVNRRSRVKRGKYRLVGGVDGKAAVSSRGIAKYEMVKGSHTKIAEMTGLTEAEARNYIYMRERFASEAPILRAFAEKISGLEDDEKDLALYNLKQELDARFTRHTETVHPKVGTEQMFVLDPLRNEYRLGNTGSIDELTMSMHSIIKQGRGPAVYKNNAGQIIDDLYNRQFITKKQKKILKQVVQNMDGTEVDAPRTMQFVREIASAVMEGRWDNPKQFIEKIGKEMNIANAIEKAGTVTDGECIYLQTKIKGGVKANYLQESMKARSVTGGISEDVMDDIINKSKLALEGNKYINGTLTWSQDAQDFFAQYDVGMRNRLRGISNLSNGVDFAREYKGLGISLDELAKAYIDEDPEAAVAGFLSEDRQSLVMAIYNKRDAAEIIRRGGGVLDEHYINQLVDGENITKLHIPIADLKKGTITVGEQDKMNLIFLRALRGNESWSDVYGEGLTERVIRYYRMAVKTITRARHEVGGIKTSNYLAKRSMDRAIQSASGSGRLVNALKETSIDATNNALMFLRGNYINITDLTELYKDTAGKSYDKLFGSSMLNFHRRVADDIQSLGLGFTYKGVKGPTSISGLLSKNTAERLVVFGAFGASTRDNYFQAQSYYNLGEYDLPIDDANRWRADAGILTETQAEVYKDELPGLRAHTTYMTDDDIFRAVRDMKLDVDPAGLPTAQEGMILMADDMKKYFDVKETKQITIPPDINFSDEMKELLGKLENGEIAKIQDLGNRDAKFTIGKAATGEVIEYSDRQAAILLGTRIKEGTGELVLEFKQLLDAEDGMKAFVGTDKGTVYYVSRDLLRQIAGVDTDLIASDKFAKRQDWNNYITGALNLAVEEAKRKGVKEDVIINAFSKHLGMEVWTEEKPRGIRFQDIKRTIGNQVVVSRGLIIDDLVEADAKVVNEITGGILMDIREEMTLDRLPQGKYFQGIQEIRVSRVSRFSKPHGGYGDGISRGIGLDEGVKYGLRELEMVRNRKIMINGKSYGTAENTYKWLSGIVHERAGSQFKTGSMKERITGMGRALSAMADMTDVTESDVFVRTRIDDEATLPSNQRHFAKMKPIDDIRYMDKGDLSNTILDPSLRAKDSRGFWFETPFDFQIEGDSTMRSKVFMFQDDVAVVKGDLMASEIQEEQLAIQRWSRQFMLAKNQQKLEFGDIVDIDEKAANELLKQAEKGGSEAVNRYIQLIGKHTQGSHGMVAEKMMSAKLGHSAHVTLAGMNVFADEASWSKIYQNTPANTSYMSEGFARGMLADSGLSQAQIDDIIEVMKSGEGAMMMTSRNPTFDEGAILFGYTKIASPDMIAKDSGVVIMSLGDVTRLKGDYDGDHVSKVLAFGEKLAKRRADGSYVLYSDLMKQSNNYYNKIVAGKMGLSDIQDELVREMTEFRMLAESDRQKSVTVGNFVKANYKLDVMGKGGIYNLDTIDDAAKSPEHGFDFGKRLTTADQQATQEFLSREARIGKQVGEASNLNAKMRRLAEALQGVEGINVPETIGKAHLNSMVGTTIYSSILPEGTYERLSTIYSIHEQGGISSKHLIDAMKKQGFDTSKITKDSEKRLFESLNMFKKGLETLDADLLETANATFHNLGIEDIIRLGSGAVSSDKLDEAINVGLIDSSADEVKVFKDSFKFLGEDAENATQSLIQSVREVGNFVNQGEFNYNPFLKFSLSEPGSSSTAIRNWRELSNWRSKYFIPTKEVERLYSMMGREEDFAKGKAYFEMRMKFRKQDLASKYIGMEGNNFIPLMDEARPIRTVGDDAIERVARSAIGTSGLAQGAVAGAAVFGAMWAASAIFRNGPDGNDEQLPQADQAPSSDGEYINPAAFGPAPRGAAPTARVTPRGSGYENINISINAEDAHGWSEAEIRDIVRQQLTEQMPMDVNMNVYSKDNTQKIDRQWVNEKVTNAIKFGYVI